MQIHENVCLKPYNTFAIAAKARYFVQINYEHELQDILMQPRWQSMPKLVLGGGSNILLMHDFPGLVLQIAIKGIKPVYEDTHHICLSVGAGENWHQLVDYCIDHQYAGIENLSLIPGTVGAAPIQNIGAYGVELRHVFVSLHAMALKDGSMRDFNAADCQFGYRDSIFKNSLKNQWVVTNVTIRLDKQPRFVLSYAGLQHMLEQLNIVQPNLRAVSTAVCEVRQKKLPDPQHIANAGSFFKNPTVAKSQCLSLQKQYPNLAYYELTPDHYKVSAAWLIEQCGWKGYRQGAVGTYRHHALVLVNYGGGEGRDIYQLAQHIQQSVHEKFAIYLEPEVNIIGQE